MGNSKIDAQIEGTVENKSGDSKIIYAQNQANNFSVTLPIKEQGLKSSLNQEGNNKENEELNETSEE